MSLLSHCGDFGCFIRLHFKGAIDTVPRHQGFIGISTVHELSEQGSVQVSAKGSLIQLFERSNMNGFRAISRSLTRYGTMVTLCSGQVR